MSKIVFDDDYIKNLEMEVNKLADETERNLQEKMALFNKYTEESDKLWGKFKPEVSDAEVDEILERMEKEVKEQKSKLGEQRDKYPQDKLGRLNTDSRTSDISEVMPKRFDDAKSLITDSIRTQKELIIYDAKLSNDPKEKEQLTGVVAKLSKISQIVDEMPSIPKDHQPKVLNIIAGGLERIYDGIKGVASSIIKGLGSVLTNSIKMISESFSKKQLEVIDNPAKKTEQPSDKLKQNREAIKKQYEALVDLKGITGQVKEKFLKDHFAQIDEIITPQELLKEAKKVGDFTMQVVGAKMKERKEQRQRLERLQKPQKVTNNKITPSSTPANKERGNQRGISSR